MVTKGKSKSMYLVYSIFIFVFVLTTLCILLVTYDSEGYESFNS